jgi:hypothetical protein
MNTAWWKNVSGLLTEVASARMATPVRIEAGELAGGRKGLVEYTPQINFPNPWPGGWWRLRDVMDYERIASDALLESCADHRRDFLRNAVRRARAASATFGPRDAYRIPAGQRDAAGAQRLAALMSAHGVDVRQAANGDAWIPLAQPYGRFVEEMFTVQRYPEVRLVAGRDIVRPYDVSAWSLPLMMGVTAERAELPDGLSPFAPVRPTTPIDGAAFALEPNGPETARVISAAARGGRAWIAREQMAAEGREWPAGTVFFDAAGARAAVAAAEPGIRWHALAALPQGLESLRAPRVGLYKPWTASMDEGWTRFVLEQYGFQPKALDNKAVRAGRLAAAFDAIVLPDVAKEVIATGRPQREEGAIRYFPEVPPQYAGGLDKEGASALKDFVKAGGTLIALSGSAEYLIAEMGLPVRNALAGVGAQEFASPGTLLHVRVAGDHPGTLGLPAETVVYQDKAIAFETTLPGAEMERRVLAEYPADARDILVSGFLHGAERLERRAAAVALEHGAGKVVLLGFRPQHRAQTPATFPFLFNALWWSVMR